MKLPKFLTQEGDALIFNMDDSEFVEALNVLYLPPNFPIERTYKVFMGLFKELYVYREFLKR